MIRPGGCERSAIGPLDWFFAAEVPGILGGIMRILIATGVALLLTGGGLPARGLFKVGAAQRAFVPEKALPLARGEDSCARDNGLVSCRFRVG